MQNTPLHTPSGPEVGDGTTGQAGMPVPDRTEVNHLDQAHQFDFWLGEWDLTWEGGGRGSNTITRILDGQVIQEQFTTFPTSSDDKPFAGLSLSVFDPELSK